MSHYSDTDLFGDMFLSSGDMTSCDEGYTVTTDGRRVQSVPVDTGAPSYGAPPYGAAGTGAGYGTCSPLYGTPDHLWNIRTPHGGVSGKSTPSTAVGSGGWSDCGRVSDCGTLTPRSLWEPTGGGLPSLLDLERAECATGRAGAAAMYDRKKSETKVGRRKDFCKRFGQF